MCTPAPAIAARKLCRGGVLIHIIRILSCDGHLLMSRRQKLRDIRVRQDLSLTQRAFFQRDGMGQHSTDRVRRRNGTEFHDFFRKTCVTSAMMLTAISAG